MKKLLLALMLLPAFAAGPAGAAPAGPHTAQKPAAKPAARAAARGTITFFVTTPEGKPIPEATVSMTGPTSREGAANQNGVVRLQSVRTGSYRVRAEAPGFVTLERDITMRNGLEVEITLNPAPAPPEPPEAAEQPAPEQPSAPLLTPDPSATIEVTSVVDFFSRNQLPRGEARRETVVGRAGEAAAALLQVRGALEGRANPAADEVLYVINGKAEVNSKGRIFQVETGSLLVVPRGVTYSIVNRGRDPLWALSVLAGQAGASAPE